MAWYHIPGKDQDVVVSTRVRLSRNIAELPFPPRLDAARAREVITRVGEILEKNGFSRLEPGGLSRTAAYALVEKQYVEPSFLRESLPHAVFLNEPCDLSISVCEEDHIRLGALRPGLSLGDALAGAMEVEALLDRAMELAFDERLGYLTRSPDELGTGLRASVILSLPLLGTSGRMEGLMQSLSQTGLSLRALGGERGGWLYRLSNRTTLGASEEELIGNLDEAARRIMENERRLRSAGGESEQERLVDRVCRAEGILRSARLMSAEELVSLLDDVRLGAAMGILSGVKVEALTALLIEAMPAGLALGSECEGQSEQVQARIRARLVQERLGMGA